LSEGRLASGCYDTPIEKLIYGDGAFSFVYNSESDKHIYILDYLSNQQFIEYALAHELGHLTFDESKYAFSEEIYLKANTVVKNFNVSGASKFARHLMSDKGFFLDYIAKYDSLLSPFFCSYP
jgi:Zn-dependent peptidase ImmA (M78 family)